MKVIPITYHKKQYPNNIKSNIDEIAGNLDKEKIEVSREYSLHTEYSHMKRNLDNQLLNKYSELKNSHKDNIPQLWKSKLWAEQFAQFIIELVGNNQAPKVIEIHPPFNDYCLSFDEFFERYEKFEEAILKRFPDVKIFIENRCGTFYRGGKFILSKAKDIVFFLEELKNKNLRLQLVLDYPQVFSAELIKMDNINLDKIINFNENIKDKINYIGGFHIWGKKKKEESGRWLPHNGNLDTFFSNNNDLKKVFLNSIINTFNDDKERFFVPEVNSGEEDLQAIVNDLEVAGVQFPKNDNTNDDFQHIIAIEWIKDVPYFNLYNTKTGINKIKIVGLKNIKSNNKKRCIGCRNLTNNERIICNNKNLVFNSNLQCYECKEKEAFKNCVMCKGDLCRFNDSSALNYCNEEHYVYLAYFPGGIVKVGTAHHKKKKIRLQEQGAMYAFIIAKTPNGKIARMIETSIVKLGIKEFVTVSYKIKHLTDFDNVDAVIGKLQETYEYITNNLPQNLVSYLSRGVEHFSQYELFKNVSNILSAQSNTQLSLFGDNIVNSGLEETDAFINDSEIISVIGNVGIIKVGICYKAINLKKILGFELEHLS